MEGALHEHEVWEQIKPVYHKFKGATLAAASINELGRATASQAANEVHGLQNRVGAPDCRMFGFSILQNLPEHTVKCIHQNIMCNLNRTAADNQ